MFSRAFLCTSGNEKTSPSPLSSIIVCSSYMSPTGRHAPRGRSADSVVGHVLKFTDQLSEELGALADDRLQLGRDLAGQREQDVRILTKLLRQLNDARLGRRASSPRSTLLKNDGSTPMRAATCRTE